MAFPCLAVCVQLDKVRYLQMAGRAGRAGVGGRSSVDPRSAPSGGIDDAQPPGESAQCRVVKSSVDGSQLCKPVCHADVDSSLRDNAEGEFVFCKSDFPLAVVPPGEAFLLIDLPLGVDQISAISHIRKHNGLRLKDEKAKARAAASTAVPVVSDPSAPVVPAASAASAAAITSVGISGTLFLSCCMMYAA